MKILQSKLTAVLGSFILGVLTTFLIVDDANTKDHLVHKQDIHRDSMVADRKPIKLNTLDNDSDPFANINKIHNQIRKRMNMGFGGSFFSDPFFNDSRFDDFSTAQVEIQKSEDDDYKYIEIIGDNLNRDTLNIEIKNGIVSISGESKKVDDQQRQNSRSFSSFVSRFSQSFEVPFGVQDDQAKIETKGNKIIIKFPKVKV